jgi:tetratricopeptide (TPR) repeat protein
MLSPETPAGGGQAGQATILTSPRAWVAATLILLLLVGAALAVYLRFGRGPTSATAEEDEDVKQLLAVSNPGYVGIEACAECHAQRATVFKTSRHFLACRTAEAGVTAAGFNPGRGRYRRDESGLSFEMRRAGDEFLIDASHNDQRVSYRVGLVYGSGGKRDEMYFAWQDDKLYHLPVAWLQPFDCWGNAVNSIHGRETPPSCLECHNTWVAHVPGTANQYRRDDAILGITCERCHGLGREHVEHHRAHPKDEAPHAILHPGKLSRERLMDVCGQCHGNTRALGRPFSYRPGEPLGDFYHSIQTKHPEDDTTNQIRYLGQSKCFKKSEMTCITCHDPHRPKSAQAGCMKCHSAASCPDQPRLPEAVRGDCVGCHMPPRVWMHVHFYTTSNDQYLPIGPRADHRIGKYPEARKAVLLAWLRTQKDDRSRTEAGRLAEQLSEHWLAEAQRRREAHRLTGAIGAFREALKVAPNKATRERMQEVIDRQTELDELVQEVGRHDRRSPEETAALLKKILKIKPDHAFAHGQLGMIYGMTGRHEEAIAHLKAVAECDPNDSFGVTLLGWMALQGGRPQEAAALCAQAEKIDAGHAMNHSVWGTALAKQRRWAEAEQQFRKTLASNPMHTGGNQGMSEALRQQGQPEEAVRFARRAVRWSDPQNAEARLTLADAYAAAGRPADARKAMEQALAAAESTNPQLAATIRARLRDLP